MTDDRDAVVAALRSTPGDGYELQNFPIELPVTVFGGFYGFGPRAMRPPLPSLGLRPPPLFAHFERPDGREPHGVSKMAAMFESEKHATAAAQDLARTARGILVAEDAPDLVDIDPVPLGDEFVWGWHMTVETQAQVRTDVGWRRGSWVLNLLSWSRTIPVRRETIEMAVGFDHAVMH